MDEVLIKNQDVIVDFELPEHCVLTKGVHTGELLLFSIEEWHRFSTWLEGLSSESKSNRIIRRHFIVDAEEIEISKIKDEHGNDQWKISVPIILFSWIGGFVGGNYTIQYVAKRPDSWTSRWEVQHIDWDEDSIKNAYMIEAGNLRALETLFRGHMVVLVDLVNRSMVLDDNTKVDIFLNRSGNNSNDFFINEMNITDEAISGVQIVDWCYDEGEAVMHTWRIEATTENGTIVRILEVKGPENEYGSGFILSVMQ